MSRAFAILAVSVALLANGAAGSSAAVGTSCGSATAVDQTAPLGRAVPVGDVLWLGVYPFRAGYPTKVVVIARRRIQAPVVLRGWSCASGSSVRFWYREGLPFAQTRLPVTRAEMQTRGAVRATFGPWPARAMRGGYLLFWRTGLWRIAAYQDGRPIGMAIVPTRPD